MARYIDAEMLENEVFTPHIYDINRDDVIALIAEQPTADVEEVKHGEWKASVMSTGAPHCSLCNGVAPSRYTYCPHCGAKMDGGKTNEFS